MTTERQPKYSIGDRVKTFRGEEGTITGVFPPSRPGASFKYDFEYDDRAHPGHYYEEVFEPLDQPLDLQGRGQEVPQV